MLWAENVLARRYFYPGLPPDGALPHAVPGRRRAAPARPSGSPSACWSLPTGTSMTVGRVTVVAGLVRARACADGPALRAALRACPLTMRVSVL